MARSQALQLLEKMLAKPEKIDGLRKAWTQPATATSGIQQYNLEAPSKHLFPVITPLRNATPRYKVTGGNAINWRAITAINVNNVSPGVSEGNRNAYLTSATKDYTRKFCGIGHEDYVTFEADYSAEGFEDIRSTAMENTMYSTMISEEFLILGGNGSGAVALGTAPTPSGVAAAGGTMSARNPLVCRVVALTVEGMRFAGTTGPLVAQTVRNNADGSVDVVNGGTSIRSAESAGVNVGLNNKVTWTCTAVRGAYAYAWFTGLTGATRLAGITSANTFVQTADEDPAAQLDAAFTADYSNNALVFDGLLSLIADPTAGGVWKSLDGAVLTGNTDGSISEIDSVLSTMWNTSRTTVDEFWVNIQEVINITKKALAGGTSTAFRITLDGNTDLNSLQVGAVVGSYLSKFTMNGGKPIPVRLHPNMPAGTIMGLSKTLPYRSNNVPAVWRMAVRREYYGQDWPLSSRKYEHGVYADEVLQLYAPFACFVLTNIGNG